MEEQSRVVRRVAPWAGTVLLLGMAETVVPSWTGAQSQGPADQMEMGRQLYETRCQACHVSGGIGGELTGSNLAMHRTANDLYFYVSNNMPWGAPGSLSPEEYWAVLAFLLKKNGLLPRDMKLGPESPPEILIREVNPPGS